VRLGRFACVLAALTAAAPCARAADAKEARPPVVIWPTVVPAGDGPSGAPLHKPQPQTEKDLYAHAQELDATLRDAVQDLGFTLYVTDAGPERGHMRDQDLVERAARSAEAGTPEDGTWVVSPRVESASGGDYLVRIVAVPPKGHELRVRVETVPGDSVSVRGLVMLRDLLTPVTAAQVALEEEREQAARGSTQGILTSPRSAGRAVLAVNAGLFGGFTAYSAQRASGSSDPRVLYPLLALGTGIGLGGSLLVADEWDVTNGGAWFLSAGGWWGAASAYYVSVGANIQPTDERFAWAVAGGLIGVTLASFTLTQAPMDDGDAMLAHSGGALGLVLGGSVQLLDRGSTAKGTPSSMGMGIGTAVGLAGAGLLATQVTVSPSRVLLIDLGAGAGALLGAAAASPLIFQNPTPGATRGWISAGIAGALGGGVLAWYLTRDAGAAPKADLHLPGVPLPGVIGESATRTGAAPIYGLAWSGAF
jgi:hypothetical protein